MAVSSDSEDESFVDIGKPLPFLEGGGKTKPITLQDAPRRSAQDAKERPRFHGAFTGGFSAGYFNTVGSKEGWTPSAFVSSRQQKQETTIQQPEDFMDEEDLGDHGIAPRQFATSDMFSSDAQSRKRKAEVMSSTRDSILPASAVLTDLIVPERLPIGIKLLRKMGWKEGQGVGPRMKVKKKTRNVKKASGVKIYGCSLPPKSDEEDESDLSDLDLQNVTFAPKDVTPINLTSKDNVHGLGYSGLDPRSALPATHVSLFEPAAVRSSKSKKGIRGQAFGVGALEEEDEDIYTTDSLSNYDQTMELDDSQQLFGWTAPGARQGKSKPDQQKVPVSYVGKLLEGFTLSAKPLPPKKVFPAPTLPRGFQPFHKFKKTAQQLALEAVGEAPSVAACRQQDQQKLNAVERGLMLGESPIASSVFDLIPKEDVRRMEAVKEAAKMSASRFQSAGTSPKSDDSATQPVPQTDQPSHPEAKKAPSPSGEKAEQSPLFPGGLSIKPFHKHPAKQARYEKYLTLVKQGVKEPYEEVASRHMMEWERQREKEEFSKAARIYRPLSNMMASRFTRGAFIDDAEQQPSGLEEAGAEKSEQAKAAEMKMYGRLTREDVEWHPHNLLCKRFNVPNPYPDSDIVGVPGLKRDKFSVFNFLTVPSQPSAARHNTDDKQDAPKAKGITNALTRELNASKRKKGALSIFSVLEQEENTPRKALPPPSLSENTEADDVDKEGANDENEDDNKEDEDNEDDGGRPKDLFRAIFKNSDSESSSSSEKSDSDKSDDDDEDVPAENDGGAENDRDEGEKREKEGVMSSVPDSAAAGSKDSSAVRPSYQPDKHQPSSAANNLQPSSPPGPPPPLHPPQPTTASPARPRPRKGSRWDVGSIFDVLDQSPPRTSVSARQEGEGGGCEGGERLSPPVPEAKCEEVETYGPALPPGGLKGSSSASPAVSVSFSFPGDTHRKHKHKRRDQERDSSKHRHKKEKKKKSKHKKEKKKKKKSKHSHREHHGRNSSGSEADSDTNSEA